jgi:hypothetical protein
VPGDLSGTVNCGRNALPRRERPHGLFPSSGRRLAARRLTWPDGLVIEAVAGSGGRGSRANGPDR